MQRLWKIISHPLVVRILIVALSFWLTFWLAPKAIELEGQNRFWVALLTAAVVALMLLAFWIKGLLDQKKLDEALKAQGKGKVEEDSSESAEIEALRGEFERACAELSSSSGSRLPWKRNTLYTLPWIVIFGPPAAGKTSALRRSGLRFTPLGRALPGVGGTANCTWWLSEEAIILDTAGRYAVQEQDHDEWIGFLGLLRKYRKKRPVDGAIVQISFDSLVLMDSDLLEETADQLRRRIDELILHLQVRFPISIVFNKCDRLDGFCDYFEHIDDSLRNKAWGFPLDIDELISTELDSIFSERYQSLINELERGLSTRMEAQTSVEGRSRAAAFPMEMASHQQRILHFIKVLCERKRTGELPRLRAVYFSNAVREGVGMNGVRHKLLEQLTLPIPSAKAAAPSNESHFLSGMFEQVIVQAKDPMRLSSRGLQSRWTLLAGGTLLACVLTFFGSCGLADKHQETMSWLDEVKSSAEFLEENHHRGGIRGPAGFDQILERQERLATLLEQGGAGEVEEHARHTLQESVAELWVLDLEEAINERLYRSKDCSEKGGGTSQECSDAFNALRAKFILDGTPCEGIDVRDEESAKWLGRYFAAIWAEDPRLTEGVRHPDQLESTRSLLQDVITNYFLADFAKLDYSKSEFAHRRLVLNERLAEDARKRLRKADFSELFISIMSDELKLYPREALVHSKLTNDRGIQKQYRREGCEVLMTSEYDPRTWLTCVLQMKKDQLDGEFNWQAAYAKLFEDAWIEWFGQAISEINWSPGDSSDSSGSIQASEVRHSSPDQPLDAITEVLDSVAGRSDALLNQLFKFMGDAPACEGDGSAGSGSSWRKLALQVRRGGRSFILSVIRGNISFKLPDGNEWCDLAQMPLCPFSAAISSEAEQDVTLKFKAFEEATRGLTLELERVKSASKSHLKALDLVRSSLKGEKNAFGDYRINRSNLFRVLRDPITWELMTDEGQAHLFRRLDQLEIKLEALDLQIWEALLELASKGLQATWTPIYGEWHNSIRYSARDRHDPVAACDDMVKFISSQLTSFCQDVLSDFYQDLQRCELQKDYFGHTLPISGRACNRINHVRNSPPDCTVDPAPAPLPPLELEAFRCAGFESSIRYVELDDGSNVTRFDIILGRSRVLSAPTSGTLALSVIPVKGRPVPIPMPRTMRQLVHEIETRSRKGRIMGKVLSLNVDPSLFSYPIGRSPQTQLIFTADILPKAGPALRTPEDLIEQLRKIELPEELLEQRGE